MRGLGPQLLADLAALLVLQAPRFSGLFEAVQAALRHFQSTQLHTGRQDSCAGLALFWRRDVC